MHPKIGAPIPVRKYCWQLPCKRGIDASVALTSLLLLAPVFVTAAIAVKLSSAGPIFFRQEREGQHGKRFIMIKFRTMYVDPPQDIAVHQAKLAASGTLVKLRRDPRVTKVGRWLRMASIDELPQLWNVMRGEMSLVGPRPLIPFMLESDEAFRQVRASMRPGITGLWQLRDRANNTTAEAMRFHDLEYIERFSLALDLVIFLRTIPAVITGKGAY